MVPLSAEGTEGPGANRWPCPLKREAIWYSMGSGVVSTRNCSAEASRGDEKSRSTAPARRVIHAQLFTREVTIASSWAALSAPAALG